MIPADGRLVLVEPVRDPNDPNQRALLFLDLHVLVIHGSGERTAEEFAALLTSASFRLTQVVPIGIIEAVPVV